MTTTLDRETDARFWAQTGYRPGHHLDPADPTDKAMIPAWLDIRTKVQREDRAGRLVLTYNHPLVDQHLRTAAAAMGKAEAHLDAAVGAPSEEAAAIHVAAASDATASASTATRAAAALQPATVSPIVVTAASQAAARAAGARPQPPLISTLPISHPAVASPAAQPAVPPDIVANSSTEPVVPRDSREHLALAQAAAAPDAAVRTHAFQLHVVFPRGTLHASTISEIRSAAESFAAEADADFLGVSYPADGRWFAEIFETAEQAADWYGQGTDTPEKFRYFAHFDRTDSRSWPHAVNEVFGTGQAIEVHATNSDTPLWPAFALGAAGLVGLVALGRGGRSR